MPAPHHSVFTGLIPFLPPNQQRQSTEGQPTATYQSKLYKSSVYFSIYNEVDAVADRQWKRREKRQRKSEIC